MPPYFFLLLVLVSATKVVFVQNVFPQIRFKIFSAGSKLGNRKCVGVKTTVGRGRVPGNFSLLAFISR